jgi:LIVCS family branched-chain amino acid:cation transporter
MKKLLSALPVGLAMFSMFFGAGNIVFPIAVGKAAGNLTTYAILGLLVTAVGVPFIGLLAMILFDGDYKAFFYRIGPVPGFALILLILGMIGPFGAMPRCIALSFAAVKIYLPGMELWLFSILSAILVYACTFDRSGMMDLLGRVMSPALLACLLIIIVKGFLVGTSCSFVGLDSFKMFSMGFVEGYNTMDLLATGFFSHIIIVTLKETHGAKTLGDVKKVMSFTLRASIIGVTLLALVYIGMAYVASYHAKFLTGVATDELLIVLAYNIMGPIFAIIASIAIAFTCLTTVIALAAVCADFISTEFVAWKLNYWKSLLIVVVISAVFSNLGFMTIMTFLEPVLQVCYPALIVLALVNIAHKLYGFKPVKVPVFAAFIISLLVKLS